MTRSLAAAALLAPFVVPAGARAQDPTPASVREQIAEDLPDNQAMEISPADVRGVLLNLVDLIPIGSDIDLRVSPWARANSPTGTVPAARLASGGSPGQVLARGLGGVTAWSTITVPDVPGGPEIDARIAAFARAVSPSGTIPTARLAAGGSNGNFLTRTATGHAWTAITVPAAAASWALASFPTGTAPFARLPFPDCVNGQILERGATSWACGGDDNTLPAAWALGTAPSGTIPFARMPFPDCSENQILKRGASFWACGADAVGAGGGIDTATATALIATWALRSSPTGFVPGARIASGGTAGQVVQLGAGGVLQWASIAPRTTAFIDGRVATWARLNSPSGTAPANRIGASPANAQFLSATSATGTDWRALVAADVPNLDAAKVNSGTFNEQRIPGLPGERITSGTVNAQRIDNALTRDAEIPDALLAAAPRGFGTAVAGDCLQRVTGSGGTTRNNFIDWAPCPSGGAGTVSLVTDHSTFTATMARSEMRAAARQITIAAGTLDADQGLSVASNCISVAAAGAGRQTLQVSMRFTPNRSDDTDPADQGGPHRIFGEAQIRRTRSSVTTTLDWMTEYVRGWQSNSSPASQVVRMTGDLIMVSGDTYCFWIDATANSAAQGQYLTITEGNMELFRDRLVTQ